MVIEKDMPPDMTVATTMLKMDMSTSTLMTININEIFMDIEVKRMSPETFEMLEQLSIVCKRHGVNYSSAPQNQRNLLDRIALYEYQLNKVCPQG